MDPKQKQLARLKEDLGIDVFKERNLLKKINKKNKPRKQQQKGVEVVEDIDLKPKIRYEPVRKPVDEKKKKKVETPELELLPSAKKFKESATIKSLFNEIERYAETGGGTKKPTEEQTVKWLVNMGAKAPKKERVPLPVHLAKLKEEKEKKLEEEKKYRSLGIKKMPEPEERYEPKERKFRRKVYVPNKPDKFKTHIGKYEGGMVKLDTKELRKMSKRK